MSSISHAVDNLQVWVTRWKDEHVGEPTIPVVAAAEHLLRVMSPEAVEDREYHTVDLALPVTARCGAYGSRTGRTCSRRYGHVSDTHRDGEITWPVTFKIEEVD